MAELPRLESWKEIAQYLGRDTRTAMRWEGERGLPVRRLPGGKRSGVFAYREDLDAWLAAQPATNGTESADGPTEPAGTPLPRWRHTTGVALAIGLLILLGSGVALARLWTRPDLAAAMISGEELVATDARGAEAWRYRFPHIDGNIVLARALVTDLDDDGRPELLAAVHFMARDGQAYGSVLLFDHRGRLQWERSLEDRYRFGEVEYAPAWFPEDIVVYRAAGAARIAVAEHHHTWWPGVVATYDEHGQLLHRFVNAGWIRSLNVTADGRHLLAAGISNSFGGAALAVLDAARPAGASPAADGTLPACANCPSGAPVAYFVSPWTELGRPSDTPSTVVNVTTSGIIEWHASQRVDARGTAPAVIISISPELGILQRGVNDYFAELRARLARSGELPPASSNWREPPVHEWTPDGGWRRPAR